MKRTTICVAGLIGVLGGTAHAIPHAAPDAQARNDLAQHATLEHAAALWQPVYGWLDHHWRVVNGWATYEARTRPGAMVAYWLSEGMNRVLGLFSPDGRGPLPGLVGQGVFVAMPVDGEVSSSFGYRRHPITGKRTLHKGMDFRAPRGTRVHAAGPGVITTARYKGSYGRLVIVAHGMGLETRYAHLHRISVREGDFVAAGALLGTVGTTGRSTGPHLHFEVRQFGEPVDPQWALGGARPTLKDELAAMLGWLVASE